MSQNNRNILSKHFVKRSQTLQELLDQKLCTTIEGLNSRHNEYSCARSYIEEIADYRKSHGDQWLQKWNHTEGLYYRFASKKAAETQCEKWESTILLFDGRLREGLTTIKHLINNGANPNAIEGHPLWLACKEGNLPIIKILCANGASLQRRSGYPYSTYARDPLEATWSCGANNTEATKLLVKLGCEPTGQDIYWAKQRQSYGVAEFLKKLGFHETIPPKSRRCVFGYFSD
jgi:hypothetical protein